MKDSTPTITNLQGVTEVTRLFRDLCRTGKKAMAAGQRRTQLYSELRRKKERLESLLAQGDLRNDVDSALRQIHTLLSEEKPIALAKGEDKSYGEFIRKEMRIQPWFPSKKAEIVKATSLALAAQPKSGEGVFPKSSEELLTMVDVVLTEAQKGTDEAKPLPRKKKKAVKKLTTQEFWLATFGTGIALADVVLAIQCIGLAVPIAIKSMQIGGTLAVAGLAPQLAKPLGSILLKAA